MRSQYNTARTSTFQLANMSDREFKRFSEFVYAECGIKLPLGKKLMLTSRLNKRLRALNVTSFDQYYDYVLSPKGRPEELTQMIDVVTTNKTEFFREAAHFDLLADQVLPALVRSDRAGNRSKLHVWSAGCSSGEEPYTLAMVLSEFFKGNMKDKFSILATDISTQVLANAKQAIYRENVIEPVPHMLKRKYLMRGKGSKAGSYRIVPELCNCVTFRRLNFMDRDFGIKTPVDIIFCRNVIIYFDRQTQIELFNKFYTQLVPGGYLFIGHSETLHGISNQFQTVAPTVYRKESTTGVR